ncbi:hypothetical protein [Thomasclavelia cocleata]|uniref:hypothetical protein n=1 Tax=Thomasclavelia cocleata TaxID=69824 RepID=UPI002636C3BF|nr:hypothetical protein [Thomasclavelia cocleata]
MFKDKNEKIVVKADNQGIAIGKMGNSNTIIQTSKVKEKEGFIKRIIRMALDVWEWFTK